MSEKETDFDTSFSWSPLSSPISSFELLSLQDDPHNTNDCKQSWDPERHSPVETMIDADDGSADALLNEKEDIAIISPGPMDIDSVDAVTDITSADDCIMILPTPSPKHS